MLDALFKPKFYTKCKSCLKLIKIRIETILKKRNAVQKFLKNDIADLLRNSLCYNAYERARGLLVEQNMSSCYELVAKFATCIWDHLRDLSKQRDCPDECKEAIPSLIYAAAWISDLPELRDLRTLFTHKFANSLQPYISKEFVEKLRHDPPSKEMKVQLLHDLAKEFSIEWDSKSLEQKLYSPPQLHHQEKPKHDPVNAYDDGLKWHKKADELVTEAKPRDEKQCHASKGDESEDETTTDDSSSVDGQKAGSSSLGSASEGEAEPKKPLSYRLVPPPYVKEKVESSLKKPTTASEGKSNHEPVVKEKPIPRSVRRRPLKPVSDHKCAEVDSRDEEKVMDGLVMHYSKKQIPPYEPSIEKTSYKKSNLHAPFVRRTSLPPEDTSRIEFETPLKGHGRASSLVPEMVRTEGHVHPCLPDYEELSARLASLRAR